jgi:dolichyl-phosphate beta-glucosyltransferase
VTTSLVLPFYNESGRIRADGLALLDEAGLDLVLVDDGSHDDTAARLEAASAGTRARVLSLAANGGKAEAVRRGLIEAVNGGASVVGYADGDLATPVEGILRLADLALADSGHDAYLGSRVRLAGRSVERRATRHYLGRIIATYLDLRVGLRVYDTQCGAKFFRVSPALSDALRQPFMTRWLFDVELLDRLRRLHREAGRPLRLREEPLEMWADVAGSRLRGRELLRVLRDFGMLERALRWDGDMSGKLSRVSLR